MRRLRVRIAYDGTDFQGWQVQPGLPTIQGTIEEVLAGIEGDSVRIAGSGRTDAGVHALAQVASFDLRNPIPPENLKKAMNRLLPPSIRILSAEETHPDFHARYDAVGKTYEFRIFRGETCPPHECRYVHHHPYPMNWAAAAEAAPVFEGEHDFSAFAAADVRDQLGRSKVRTIFSSQLMVDGDSCRYRVRGSGFLKHMVRNLVGTLIEVGKGNFSADDLRRLLREGKRPEAGPTAPAKGLFLISVDYPETAVQYSNGSSSRRR